MFCTAAASLLVNVLVCGAVARCRNAFLERCCIYVKMMCKRAVCCVMLLENEWWTRGLDALPMTVATVANEPSAGLQAVARTRGGCQHHRRGHTTTTAVCCFTTPPGSSEPDLFIIDTHIRGNKHAPFNLTYTKTKAQHNTLLHCKVRAPKNWLRQHPLTC